MDDPLFITLPRLNCTIVGRGQIVMYLQVLALSVMALPSHYQIFIYLTVLKAMWSQTLKKPFLLILGTPKKHSWSILLSNLKILQGLEFNYFEVMEDLSFTSPPMLVICSSMMNGERQKPYGSLYISFLFIFSSSRLGLITLSSQEKRSVSWHRLSPGVLRT